MFTPVHHPCLETQFFRPPPPVLTLNLLSVLVRSDGSSLQRMLANVKPVLMPESCRGWTAQQMRMKLPDTRLAPSAISH